ncbi:MAG: MFS transporter, partial [Lachnospiraceae bacterium]|nr:MFS transporter [Lachnospiraceae bacterium]
LISVLRSIGTGIQTPAVNAAIPQIVPEDKLMKFNGANSTVQSLVQFATPAVAGAILSLKTIQFSLFIDIITAIVGIVILTVVSIQFAKKEDSPSTLAEMKAGIVYAVKERFIGKMLLVFGAFIFLCVPAGFLAALFVTRYYGETYWYMSLVEVIGSLGMVVFGPLADVVSMRVLMVVSGVLLLVMATGILIDRKFYSKGMMRDADPEEHTN